MIIPRLFINNQKIKRLFLYRKYSNLKKVQYQINNISQFCKVQIILPFDTTVTPLDPIDFPNGDSIRLTLTAEHGDPKVEIKTESDSLVQVTYKLNEQEHHKHGYVSCHLNVPVKADIDICSERSGTIVIEDLQSNNIKIQSLGSGTTQTKNLRCSSINMFSKCGIISCLGLLQAHIINVATQRTGNIHFERVQGNELFVHTDKGCISTGSCYVTDSLFNTVTGNMMLKNVHRNCKLCISEDGNLTMSGFNGTLQASVNKGNVSLHTSNLEGYSKASIQKGGQFKLFLAENVCNNCKVNIVAKSISLEPSSKDIFINNLKMVEPNHVLNFSKGEESTSRFEIENLNGAVSVGKMSWIESQQNIM